MMKQFRRLTVFTILAFLLGINTPVRGQSAYAGAGFWNNGSIWPTYLNFQYGNWSYANSLPQYERAMVNDVFLADMFNSSATFNFTGQRVTYWYSKAYNRGRFNVYLDGVHMETVSACYPVYPQVIRQISRTWTLPSYGNHTIKIENGGADANCAQYGSFIDIDAFSVDITGNIPDVNIVGFDDTDSSIRFSPQGANPGEWYPNSNLSGAYLGTLRTMDQSGRFYRFTTQGSGIALVLTNTSNRGFLTVNIDGIDRGTFDLYNATMQRQRIFTFLNLDIGLTSGVVIDTHIINAYFSGNRSASASQPTFVDLDRVETTRNNSYPNLFNIVPSRVEINSIYAVRASIATSDPTLRFHPDSAKRWSYMRPYVQKLNTSGGVSGFAEIGHFKNMSAGHQVYWSCSDPSGVTFAAPISGLVPLVGSTYMYEVRRTSSNAWSLYFNWSSTPNKICNTNFNIADTWGVGGETPSTAQGIGPAQVFGVQYVNVLGGSYIYSCPNTEVRSTNIYTYGAFDSWCYNWLVTGNN